MAIQALRTDQRDYIAEMSALLDQMVPDGDYIPSVVAEKIFRHLERKDPDLFIGWAWSTGHAWLTESITSRAAHRSQVAMGRRRRLSRGTSLIPNKKKTGRISLLDTVEYEINAEHERRRLGDMDKECLLYAAGQFAMRVASNQFQETFLRALAKKVGDRKVRDVFSDEQIEAMLSGD